MCRKTNINAEFCDVVVVVVVVVVVIIVEAHRSLDLGPVPVKRSFLPLIYKYFMSLRTPSNNPPPSRQKIRNFHLLILSSRFLAQLLSHNNDLSTFTIIPPPWLPPDFSQPLLPSWGRINTPPTPIDRPIPYSCSVDALKLPPLQDNGIESAFVHISLDASFQSHLRGQDEGWNRDSCRC